MLVDLWISTFPGDGFTISVFVVEFAEALKLTAKTPEKKPAGPQNYQIIPDLRDELAVSWKRKNVYKQSIFGFHVSFRGCTACLGFYHL